jgi:hypothetical protein
MKEKESPLAGAAASRKSSGARDLSQDARKLLWAGLGRLSFKPQVPFS